jgi:MOSC domain-containing protein YiiM
MSELTISTLQQRFSQPGEVVSICTRPSRLAPVTFVEEVEARAGKGLMGDRYQNNGVRQVTLIAEEDLKSVSSFLRRTISLSQVRRNSLTKGINLLALKGKQFQVGDAILEFSGECHPCSRMETNLGEGGYNAMRGNGGIPAKVIQTGVIRTSDKITPIISSS